MASKDVKIFLKTVADATGITKIGGFLKKHVSEVGVLKAAYAGLATVAAGLNKGFHAVADGLKKASLATAGAVAGSVREFYVWNKEAARAWTMMDTGREGFVKLRKEISKLSPELGVAKSELGKGWYQALSSGVAQDQLIPFLRTAAKVAVADGSTIETAIDGITTVLNSYKMETSQAAAVTDLMFKTVANGKTTFGDLAAYISQAAPTASALGVGLDQVLAAVATLTKQGVPTATAMTQIRNSMLALNGELGDGWSKSMTFQEALQKVGSEAGFSAVALEKAFGRENVGAVLAMIGENAANAAADLATMRAEGGGLEEAFAKVDSQVGHWPRIWQSIRELVSQVGEALDTKLKPVIDFVAKKLNALGDGKGFAGFVEGLSSRIADLVAQAVAGVQTVIDVLGKTSIGGAISATVNALVDLVVTLLAEGLRSLGTVVVALAKIFGAAIKGEVMKIDIWGRDETKAAREAARKNIANLSPEQAESLGVPSNVFGGDDAMMSQEQFKRRKKQQREYIDSLDLDQAVAIATANRDQDIGGALSQAGESFAASRERIGTAGGRIVEGLSRRTGVDVGATYEANLAGVRGALPGAPGPVASAAVPSAATAAPAAVSVAGSSAAAGTGAQRMADEAGAARKATEDSMDAATDLFRAFQESQRQQAQQMRDLKAAVSQIPNV